MQPLFDQHRAFDQPRVQFAIDVVRKAAQLVRRVQQEMVSPALAKQDRSPVTVADFAAQGMVAKLLSEQFSEDFLVGEENSTMLREGDGQETLEQITRFIQIHCPEATPTAVCDWIDQGTGCPPSAYWTLDPVDGTKGFLRGDQYAVALAYVEDGVVQIGVLGCPELADASQPATGGSGSLVVAVRGGGTLTQSIDGPSLSSQSADDQSPWKSLSVSGRCDVSAARLLCSVEKAHTDPRGIGALVTTLEITADPVPLDSQAKYAVLAAGEGDVNLRLLSPSRLDYREKVWDQAAGSIVVEEAGGRVTDLDGKPLDFSQGRTLAANRGVLATNSHLHEAILAGLQQIEA
jgi:3'(2'), 5'-bisphosphate nucleotidase